MKPRLILLGLVLLLAPRGSDGDAVISAASCAVSPLIACPAGDLAIHVTVRRSRTPVPGAGVTIDMGACPDFRPGLPVRGDAHRVEDGSRFVRATGARGGADFLLRSGAWSCTRIVVRADGIMIAERAALASPDQNGDLVVDRTDLALLRSRIGRSDPSADLDGDGRVAETDAALAQAHLGHRGEIVTPTPPTTWGEIKSSYR